MDPTQAIIAPWMQYGVVGSVVVALAYVCWTQRSERNKRDEEHRREIAERNAAQVAAVEKCHDKTMEITVKNIEAQNRMSDALDGNSEIMKAALEALKTR